MERIALQHLLHTEGGGLARKDPNELWLPPRDSEKVGLNRRVYRPEHHSEKEHPKAARTTHPRHHDPFSLTSLRATIAKTFVGVPLGYQSLVVTPHRNM